MTPPLNDDTAVLSAVPAAGPDEPHDDLATELAKAAPRRWWNKGTVLLGAAVLLVGSFASGLQVQKTWGTSATSTAASRAAGPGGFGNPGFGQGGAMPGAGGTAPASAAASATTGKVKLVNGTTIYLETADGTVVTVKTDAKTSVATASKGKLSDVKAGQSVTVQGATGSDGTMTATSVTAQRK